MTERQADQWKGLPHHALHAADVTVDERGTVWIPYRLLDGRLYARRAVARTGGRWWDPGDGRSVIPYALERLTPRCARRWAVLVIVEGESDALALEAAHKAEGVDALGVPGSSCWRSSWATLANGYAAVYVAGDGDSAGRWLVESVLRDVPGVRPLRIPASEDVRSILQGPTPQLLAELFEDADRTAAAGYAITHGRNLGHARELAAVFLGGEFANDWRAAA